VADRHMSILMTWCDPNPGFKVTVRLQVENGALIDKVTIEQ